MQIRQNIPVMVLFMFFFRTADDIFPSTSYSAITQKFSDEDFSTFAKTLKEKNP